MMSFKMIVLYLCISYYAKQVISIKSQDRIVGGTTASEGEIPWQVSIQTVGATQHCGGSILNEEWILTAGHCVDSNPGNFRIRSGSLIYNEGGTLHEISDIIRYEDFNTSNWRYDIAVMRVDPPFVFDGAMTAPVSLPDQGTEISSGTPVTVSGWGTSTSGGWISPALQKVEILIVDRDICNELYFIFNGIISSQICAGPPEGGKGFCTGDHGGPLYSEGTVFGIVSYSSGCAYPDFPGIYTKVADFTNWIIENTTFYN